MGNQTSEQEQRMNAQVLQAERQFNRVLAAWAGDVLELRRRNLLDPRWERAKVAQHFGSAPGSQGKPWFLPMNDAA